MTYNERCDILNKNPVPIARHFQFRIQVFFKTIFLDGPVGKKSYYAIRVEFRFPRSPHIHLYLLPGFKCTNINIFNYT